MLAGASVSAASSCSGVRTSRWICGVVLGCAAAVGRANFSRAAAGSWISAWGGRDSIACSFSTASRRIWLSVETAAKREPSILRVTSPNSYAVLPRRPNCSRRVSRARPRFCAWSRGAGESICTLMCGCFSSDQMACRGSPSRASTAMFTRWRVSGMVVSRNGRTRRSISGSWVRQRRSPAWMRSKRMAPLANCNSISPLSWLWAVNTRPPSSGSSGERQEAASNTTPSPGLSGAMACAALVDIVTRSNSTRVTLPISTPRWRGARPSTTVW